MEIESVDAAVYGKVKELEFSGPAAMRLAHEINGWHADVAGVTTSLSATAALLERSAADVEAERAARARLQARLDGEIRRAR